VPTVAVRPPASRQGHAGASFRPRVGRTRPTTRVHTPPGRESAFHATPPLAGLSDTEPPLPTEAPLYVAARRDHAADLAAELLFQRRPPGHELKPHAIVDHCEEPDESVTRGPCPRGMPSSISHGSFGFASNRRRVEEDVEGGDLPIAGDDDIELLVAGFLLCRLREHERPVGDAESPLRRVDFITLRAERLHFFILWTCEIMAPPTPFYIASRDGSMLAEVA
jgi:hypothetical protein